MEFRNLVSASMLTAKTGLEQRLASVPALSGLSLEQLAQLAAAMETVDFESGEYIVEIGTQADALFLILKGEVACHQGGESELRLSEGTFFGESCLSRGSSNLPTHSSSAHAPAELASSEPASEPPSARLRQANVVAVGSVRCARLPAAHCDAIFGSLQAALERAYSEKVLASISLFDALSSGEKAVLLTSLQPRQVRRGEVIVTQGAVGEAFYILTAGAVDILHDAADGRAPSKLQTIRGGEAASYFGERSLLRNAAAVASVLAAEDSSVLCLPRALFEQVLGPLQQLIDRAVAERDAELQKHAAGQRIQWEDLEMRAVLGVGSFGTVRLVWHHNEAKAYALKGMVKGHLIATSQVDNVVGEKKLLRRCRHPFIMECVGGLHSRTHVYLVLGLALGGELFSYVAKKGKLDEATTSMYVAQVASAFGCLGLHRIAHRYEVERAPHAPCPGTAPRSIDLSSLDLT